LQAEVAEEMERQGYVSPFSSSVLPYPLHITHPFQFRAICLVIHQLHPLIHACSNAPFLAPTIHSNLFFPPKFQHGTTHCLQGHVLHSFYPPPSNCRRRHQVTLTLQHHQQPEQSPPPHHHPTNINTRS
jgi:hypothetical protein